MGGRITSNEYLDRVYEALWVLHQKVTQEGDDELTLKILVAIQTLLLEANR